MKKKIQETLIYLALFVLIANGISYYRSGSLNQDELRLTQVNLIDGSVYKVPKNKPIMIHIWATWCTTCKIEADNIERVSKKYEVLTIAVSSGSNKKIQKYLDDNDFSFKVVNDSTGVLSEKFKVSAFPTTMIYDKKKQLEFTDVGYTSTLGLLSRMALTDK